MYVRILCTCIGEFRPQTDQRSDDSNLQHVIGKQVETVIKRYHMRYIIYHHDCIDNFQQGSLTVWALYAYFSDSQNAAFKLLA